jgi:GNAT superfamily N-acetyltransferase
LNGAGERATDHTGGVSFIIRNAQPTDMPALQRIYAGASLSNPRDRGRLLATPEWLVFTDVGLRAGRTRVAVDDRETTAGFATYLVADGVAELEDLFVDPPSMRRGLGTALVRDISEIVQGLGFDTLEVTANPEALAFYQHLGFVTTHLVPTELHPASPRMVRPIG